MPRNSSVPKNRNDVSSPAPQPSVTVPAAIEAPRLWVPAGPLAWTLGGAPREQPPPGRSEPGRRREPAGGRPPSVDLRRRRNPSSRFRG